MLMSMVNSKPKRRLMRFSLRTGLLLVTLLCAALSLRVMPGERQRRAVAAIEALGGKVFYEKRSQASSESFIVTFLNRFLPPAYFYDVNNVHLANTHVTDAGLAQFRKALPNCQILGP